MKIRFSRIVAITAAAIFASTMAAMLTFQSHVMYYQEQHRLFLFTSEYFADTVRYDGLPGYLGAFIVQFYHIPWLGAAIVALLTAWAYLLIESLIRRFTGLRDRIQLGAAAAVALYSTLDELTESPGWLVIAVAALCAAWAIAFALRKRLPAASGAPLKPLQGAVSLAFAAAFIGGGYYLQVRQFDFKARAMMRAEKAIKEQRWDDAISITDSYLAYGFKNRLMLLLRNVALARKGQLVERMFEMPMHFGAEGVFFPWTSNSRDAEYGHLPHELAGNLNAAHRWAFEAMSVWGETAPNLINLARYNVALGRPKVAQRFINKLSHSLFYRHEARSLQMQADGAIPPALHYAYAECPDAGKRRYINSTYPADELIEIIKADPGNDMARQYLTALLLSTNDLDALAANTPAGTRLTNREEEALLLYSLDQQATPLDSLGVAVQPETRERYKRLLALSREGNSGALMAEFGSTFWCYLLNYCPYGTKKNNTLGSTHAAQSAALNH